MIQLSDHEASILLGATLMHWGVPFRFASKREWTEHQQAIIDRASDKLIGPGGRLREVEAPVDLEELISKYIFGKV